jgi:hypothetical protein
MTARQIEDKILSLQDEIDALKGELAQQRAALRPGASVRHLCGDRLTGRVIACPSFCPEIGKSGGELVWWVDTTYYRLHGSYRVNLEKL